jgi:prolyl oligopeptidase
MRQARSVAIALVAFTGVVAAAFSQTVPDKKTRFSYPAAHRDATVDTYFGTKVPAPYQWMEDLGSPALKQWVEAENALTASYLGKVPVRGWIQQRLTQLWDYAKESTPEQVAGGRIFYSRNSGLQNQSVVYVADSATAAPRELLDPNALSPDGSIALLGYAASPRGAYLAYELSRGGSDWVTIHVRDVATGKDLADTIRWVKFSGAAWTEDGKGFFYSRYPEAAAAKAVSQRVIDQTLYYHRLGTDQSADVRIYARPDLPEWVINGSVSQDGRYLFIYLRNGTASENELFYVDLGNPLQPAVSGTVKPLYTKNDAMYAVVGHEGKALFLRTTLGAPKGRIVAATFDDVDPAHWRVVVPEGEGVIRGAAMAGGRILVNLQVAATSRLVLYSTAGKPEGELALPALGSVAGLSSRDDLNTVYYGFTSFLIPASVYRYDVGSGKTETFFMPDVAFDPTPYEEKQVFYPSKDGTKIPMFIVAKKGVKLDGSNPTILYAYGGFDITITPAFSPWLPAWLELGGVYAVANLRGGGEYGEMWHQAGMLGHKQNVFDDFAWAAKYLITEKYTTSKRLGIMGYSNGGLLVGASITQNPALFGAAYAGAGVIDMLRYQKFSGGALWAPEYGTSSDEKAFRWLVAYSPLANVKEGTCYPPTIITTADHDDRVVPSHSYQFAAALQHAQGCANPILIRVETKTSHGYMPTDKRIAQTADIDAFMAYNLGITAPPGAAGSAPAPH